MARTLIRTLWVSEDGQEWDTEAAALQHGADCEIVAWLESGDICWKDTDGAEVLTRLRERYEVTPRALAARA